MKKKGMAALASEAEMAGVNFCTDFRWADKNLYGSLVGAGGIVR